MFSAQPKEKQSNRKAWLDPPVYPIKYSSTDDVNSQIYGRAMTTSEICYYGEGSEGASHKSQLN